MALGLTDRQRRRFKVWFFGAAQEPEGPHVAPDRAHQHPWWQVMCLTGVEYRAVTREVLRQSAPDPMRRPRIHVG